MTSFNGAILSNVSTTLTLDHQGRRVYLRGNTFPIKDQIRAQGGRWDADKKAWWVGAGKETSFSDILNVPAQPANEGGSEKVSDDTKIRGKVSYKGKTYFLICSSRDGGSHKVCTLDGNLCFWTNADNRAEVVKQYGKARRFRGYGNRGREGDIEYPTLGSLRKFIERAKNGPSENEPTKVCWECGGSFTAFDARRNGGDWKDSYCGC